VLLNLILYVDLFAFYFVYREGMLRVVDQLETKQMMKGQLTADAVYLLFTKYFRKLGHVQGM
jgi:hypothetical protein